MKPNAYVAGAAVALTIGGFGPNADAATIVRYDIGLRYEGTIYSDLLITEHAPGGSDKAGGKTYHVFDEVLAENSGFALPTVNPDLSIGDETAYRATLVVPDAPPDPIDPFANGGRALDCDLAGVDCTAGVTATYPDGDVLFGEYRSISVGSEPGDTLSYMFNRSHQSSQSLDWGRIDFFNRIATFTILSVDQPAPVPVPASLALLFLGVGSLVLTCRRRRRP